MPHPEINPYDGLFFCDLLTCDPVVAEQGPVFFFGALCFNSVLQLGMLVGIMILSGQIVLEKEVHLRESMSVMGMRDSAYWMSWYFNNIV